MHIKNKRRPLLGAMVLVAWTSHAPLGRAQLPPITVCNQATKPRCLGGVTPVCSLGTWQCFVIERCDGIDQNGNGLPDEADPSTFCPGDNVACTEDRCVRTTVLVGPPR